MKWSVKRAEAPVQPDGVIQMAALQTLDGEQDEAKKRALDLKVSIHRALLDKINLLSLMLALFCGTASLPHILIRYYTVKDEASARKSTIVGIASIGFFYVLTLYMGLGAMTSGSMDVTNSNMAAPLLARLLEDSYSAVRFISWQKLKALPEFRELKYNFVGPPARRKAAMNSVLRDWQRTHSDVPDALPMTPDGQLDLKRLADLWKRRDQRPVEIPE